MKRASIYSLALVLGGLASQGRADVGMAEKDLSRYLGVIACVDRSYFDGGYEVGDPVREGLMTEFLHKNRLPAYDEGLASKKAADTASYMEGYQICDADYEALSAMAEKHGVQGEY